jgi:hypothetical protein
MAGQGGEANDDEDGRGEATCKHAGERRAISQFCVDSTIYKFL